MNIADDGGRLTRKRKGRLKSVCKANTRQRRRAAVGTRKLRRETVSLLRVIEQTREEGITSGQTEREFVS